MCFSAAASFTSGVVLGATGVASTKEAKGRSQLFFAGIPFIFAIQQFSEGFLWLALKGKIDPGWEVPFTYIFIFIAQVVWPFWVPLSISLLEPNRKRKKLFFALTGLGSCVSVGIFYRLLFYPVSASIEGHHISYHLGFPKLVHYLGAGCYCVATVLPPFASSVKRMPLLGLFALFSFLAAAIFYTQYVISVWCFFAAVISIVVYLIVRNLKVSNKINTAYKISDFHF